MRVLHVHSGNLYGGVETLLSTLWRERAACPSMETSFALCFEGRLSEELRATGADVHTLGAARASRPLSVRRARAALARLLKTCAFDVAVCHSAWSQALFGPVAREAGCTQAFWMHAPATGRHWLERWAKRTTPDLVVCNSRFTAESAQQLYPRARAEVVHCPVSMSEEIQRLSCDERAAVRREFETAETAVVIIQASRMEAWKGHVLHLQALKLLKGVPGWTCWLVGGAQREEEAEYVDDLKRLASRLGVDGRARFAGQRGDVPRLLAAADIYCQPNVGPEPFGIAFVEAMRAQLPVVTTVLGGALEVVDERVGALTRPDDAAHLAEALRGLILNPSMRAEMGRAGARRAREICDPAAQLEKLHGLLASVPRRRAA